MNKIEADAQLIGVYKIAALLPSLVNNKIALSTKKSIKTPIPPTTPIISKTPDLSFLQEAPPNLFYHKDATEVKKTEDISIFCELDTPQEVDNKRIGAIRDLIVSTYGESIIEVDYTTNLNTGVPVALEFAKKKGTDDLNIPSASLKAKSYLRIIDESLYSEIMLQSEVLLNSISTVSELETSYRKIDEDLSKTTQHFVTIQKSMKSYLENSSLSFLRYKNLCTIQQFLERLKNCSNLIEDAKMDSDRDTLHAFDTIEKALRLLEKLGSLTCSHQLIKEATITKDLIVNTIIHNKELIFDTINSIELSSEHFYSFDETSWMSEFEKERTLFTTIVVGHEKIKKLDVLIEHLSNYIKKYLYYFPLSTIPTSENIKIVEDPKVHLLQNKDFINKINSLHFNNFQFYIKNLINKYIRFSCIIVMFQMVMSLELEESGNAPISLSQSLVKMMTMIRDSIRHTFKAVIELGDFNKTTIDGITLFNQQITDFIHSLHVIHKKKFTSLNDVHEIYLTKFFGCLHQNNCDKMHNIIRFDDFTPIEVEDYVYNVINTIVTQIIIPPMVCGYGPKSNDGKTLILSINNDNYFITSSLSILIPTLEKYREVAIAFPTIAEHVIEGARGMLTLYNNELRRLLLKKEIGATMYTTAHQTLLLLSIISPYLHRYFSPNLVVSGRKLEGIEDELRLQCQDIRKELTQIFKNRVAYYLQTLEQKLRLLLNKIINEICALNALLKSNLRVIDYKHCVFEQSRHLNELREEFDRRASTEELKSLLSADLHEISTALREGFTTTSSEPQIIESPMIVAEESEENETDIFKRRKDDTRKSIDVPRGNDRKEKRRLSFDIIE
ncbi:Vacuolar protein sorting-associated protein 54 C-terminal domain-containing protein [Entamoeba marina]